MILYRANTRENEKNTEYPHEEEITNLDHFKRVLQYDNMPSKMKNNHRSVGNFLECNCIAWDIDNDHSDDPGEWVTKGDIEESYPFIFYMVQSRNYMKEKRKEDKKTGAVTVLQPREKWHIYAPLKSPIKAKEEYEKLINNILCVFPFLDPAAMDCARFLYAIGDPKIEPIRNDFFVDEYFANADPEGLRTIQIEAVKDFESKVQAGNYKQNKTNDTVIKYGYEFLGISTPDAAKELKEKGIDWEAIGKAEQMHSLKYVEDWAAKMGVPLGRRYNVNTNTHGHKGAIAICVACPRENEHSENTGDAESVILIDIGGKINYICRHSHGGELDWKTYKAMREEEARARGIVIDSTTETTEPSDYTDVGQANMLVSRYGGALKYTDATGFLAYDGMKWQESETRAQGLSQALTGLQLKEARKRTGEAKKALDAAKASEDADLIKEAKARYDADFEFLKYVLGRRSSNKIKATLTEARPQIEVSIDDLDRDGFLLNTPSGTVDLRTGEIRPHNAKDYCTKITTVAPDTENAKMFQDFIERVTVGDRDLERYLQEVAGMCAVGKVLRENLIIAYGEGGNGKSTLFNLLAHVLGDYSGMLSAETLTVNCRKNKSPEYAELRGKRLVIAAELEEGVRMDTAALKTLCSTDKIQAEKKYKAPFSFTPSHTVILYTNHLPKIGTSDSGTWSRIIVVPFLANFRGMKGEVKNYAEYLFDHCGGAVLTWIIEGARRFIANGYDIALPECVKQAIEEYRENSDWLSQFLEECCEIGKKYQAKAGELYERYRRYCDCTGEYKRGRADFKQALIAAGYEHRKPNTGAIYIGIRLSAEYVETPWGKASPNAV